MSRHPEVKWAQRLEKVYITIQLPDSKDANVDLKPDGTLVFSATAGTGNSLYELKLELFDKVDVEESKINKGARNIFCVLEKVEKEWWKKLLRGEGKTPHYIKVDWDKWVDEDDDSGAGDVDMGGMDFSKFGGMEGLGGMGGMEGMGGMAGMGGMGGMGGMAGMGGMGGMGGMAGMGGMGGMAGMAGMGGMAGMAGMGGMGGAEGLGDDFDASDDEDQEPKKAEGSGSVDEAKKTDVSPAKETKEATPST